jgi:hypothetical protein
MAISNEQVVAALKKNPVVTAAVVIVVVVGALLYLRADHIPVAQGQLEEKTAEGRRLAANINNSARLPEQLARVSEAAKEVESRLVRVGQLANNLQYFYRLETETGVKFLDLRQITVPSRTSKPGRIPVTFTLTLSGPYPQVMEFLRRVESGTHYCSVRSANLAPFEGTGAAGGLRSDATRMTLNFDLLGTP